MPARSKPADTAAMVSEDAIRQRAYYLWEADGRPDGTGDHYWNLAHAEATRLLVGLKSNGAARTAKGKAAPAKPAKAKPAKAEAKPSKKATPKPRAAVPAKKAK